MLRRVLRVLKASCGLEPPALIIVGISGGADSTCLVHLLHAGGFDVVAAHLDHGIRPESVAEAGAAEALAASLRVPFVTKRVDVAAAARSAHESVETAGRRIRYGFLFEQARLRGAAAVATGHTADDQVETVLMHLIRGAGLSGLKGMEHRTVLAQFHGSIPLVRPLLQEWRADTVEYCRTHSLSPSHDPSNDSLDYQRNRVRHKIIPALELYNPRARKAILRTASTLAADHTIVEAHIARTWAAVVKHEADDRIEFDSEALAAESRAVRRRLILRAVQQLAPGLDIGFATLDDAATLLQRSGSSQMQLGEGVTLTRDPGVIHLALGTFSVPTGDWPQLPHPSVDVAHGIAVRVSLAGGWQFSADYGPVSGAPLDLIPLCRDRFHACLDADCLPENLVLRWPHRGDRFRPLGLGGSTQLLSDFFVNAKLPRRARAHWPLLCSGETLIWVPGHRPAEPYKLTSATKRTARFIVSRPADSKA